MSESQSANRSARAFTGLGIAWALLVPVALWTTTASPRGGAEVIVAVVVRLALAVGAFWVAHRLRKGPVPAPPTGLAAAYALVALIWVLHGLSKGVAARSALGFLKFGGEHSEPSILFPDFYYARFMSGGAEGLVLLIGLMLVLVSVGCAVRVLRSRQH